MDAGRRPDEDTASGIEVPLTEKAEQSGRECIRKNNSRPDCHGLFGISDGYVFHVALPMAMT